MGEKGKKVSLIVFKVIWDIVCLFCFVSGHIQYIIIEMRCHSGGGNVACLFFFVSGQIHLMGSYIQYICKEMRCRSGWVGGNNFYKIMTSVISVKRGQKGFLLF